LPPVQVPVGLGTFRPAQEGVGRRLHQPLTLNHAFARLSVAALGQVVFENGGSGFLELQEQRVTGIAALEQDDECPCADTADTDDLAGHVDHLEAFQESPAVVLQRGSVGAELFVNETRDLFG
jgi:hypothetical protein